ncbi:Protein cps3 [Escovopsis weberi]|uniref:Protein cps3 n=1 Tax=Escovopsis weberi TaxID=150374 RepID=A0A0M8N7Q3_ESCWE|nr:Protein cps3 [Escovopsis weberi]
MMPEFRHMRSGSLSIPGGVHSSNAAMPRSPPNTSHVPCKFFRQGACQAGNACPFSHDLGAAAENICKYFAKGNCKFGPKCANIHILPDGRRINYGKNGVTIGPTPINLASQPSASLGSANSASGTGPYNQSTASALTSSLYRTDSPYAFDERQQSLGSHQLSHHYAPDSGLPSIDVPYSHPSSNHGSPLEEDSARLVYGLSPANGGKGLSVLDAPLPASFDSNGISNAARYPAAPWPSSVPSKFGLDPHSPSLSSVKDSRASETLKLLHTSAFGSSELIPTPTASSPPNSHQLSSEEYFGKRAMHSSRYSKPKFLSSSVPQNISVDRDWDPEFAFDDGDNVPVNLVPGDLQELLTPSEKARRGSMRGEQSDMVLDGITKYGSPIGTSPSRWNALFQRQKEEEEMGRAARSAVGSAFGHVGSPLRNSTLAQEASSDFRASSSLHRPASTRTTSEAMSALSQQLQRSRLDEAIGSCSPALHLAANRAPSNGTGLLAKDRAMERHVSTGSISSSVTGRFTTPIDEEDPAFVFSMEDEDSAVAPKTYKRASAGLNLGVFSYASAVANKGVTNGNGSKEDRDSVPVNGR